METVMVSSVAPELQALEAIKKEIALRHELRQSMQEANERHLREYNAMKEDHNKILVKVTLAFEFQTADLHGRCF